MEIPDGKFTTQHVLHVVVIVCTNTTGFTGIVGRIPCESVWPSPGSCTDQRPLIPSSHVNDDGHYATG